ncbi:hypothetical protein AB0M87_13070 [Streptomyces sp. NPDC051320]|uniref:hypothetical protein n=1 Tax=Streptomyces sp. NPDC051320 TaxID=3154644 RepID=UPI00341FB653
MSQNEPNQPQQPPQWGPEWGQPLPKPAADPTRRPGWARKRIVIPAAAVLFFVGVGIGTSGSSDDTKTAASSKPAPGPTVTATATVTAKPTEQAAAKAKPAPTVTVTATKTATAKPKPKAKTKPKESSPDGKAVFKVWGNAPAGALGPIDITYGSDSENIQGHGVPMTKTLTVDADAMYYNVTAQLQGSGDIHCSVTIDGTTKTGHAQGGYNICSAQLSGGLFGGWE